MSELERCKTLNERDQITQETLKQGYKADGNKSQFSLVPPKFLRALADLFTMGAKKYSPYNWYLGMDYSRVYDALHRHLNSWWDGEQNDPVDGQNHLISAAWGCCVLYIYDITPERFKRFDNRPHMLTIENIIVNTAAQK